MYLSTTNAMWRNDTSGLTIKLSARIFAWTVPDVLVRRLRGPALFGPLLIILSLTAADQGKYGLFARPSNLNLFFTKCS
jgi:hypothetical protein